MNTKLLLSALMFAIASPSLAMDNTDDSPYDFSFNSFKADHKTSLKNVRSMLFKKVGQKFFYEDENGVVKTYEVVKRIFDKNQRRNSPILITDREFDTILADQVNKGETNMWFNNYFSQVPPFISISVVAHGTNYKAYLEFKEATP